MPLLDHFSLIAPFYERLIPFRQVDRIEECLDLPANGRLLDVGGGTGRVAQAIRHLVSQAYVLDESLGMLLQASSKNGLNLVCSASERLPFAEDTFERVLLVDALHHVANQRATALEIWRVLKPGGKALIVEPDIRRLSAKLVAVFERLLLMRSHFLSLDEIVALFPASQAAVSRVEDDFNIWIAVEKKV